MADLKEKIYVKDAYLKQRSISVLYKELEVINFKALLMKTDDVNMSSVGPNSFVLDKEYDMETRTNTLIKEDECTLNKFSRNYRNQYEGFQNATRLVLVIGQFLGLNPLKGLHEKDLSKLRLNYLSWRYFYCLSICLLQGTAAMLCFYAFLKELRLLFKIVNLSFFLSTFSTCFLFLRLAQKWPYLMKRLLNSGLHEYVDPYIKLKCYATSTFFIIAVMVEHILAIITVVSAASDCLVQGNIYENYIRKIFFWIFEIGIPYHEVFGYFLQIIFFMSVMIWTYLDLFIMCISLYLSSILDQINNRILKAEAQTLPPSFWRSLREDYCRATSLIQAFDDAINGIVFSSVANNIFFVCLQLFYVFANGLGIKSGNPGDMCPNYPSGPFNGYEHVMYFTYSLIFVLGRTLSVFLIASKVNTSSVAAGPALFAVPTAAYCDEVQRLIDHMYGDTVAFSGMNFFFVTKQMIVTIAGTIVTYELVLMQIDAKKIIQY